jgi:hypothetical protein
VSGEITMTYQHSNRGSWAGSLGYFIGVSGMISASWLEDYCVISFITCSLKLFLPLLHHCLTVSPGRNLCCCDVCDNQVSWLPYLDILVILTWTMLKERRHKNLLCGSSRLNLSIIYETANVFMDLIQPTNSWHDLSVGEPPDSKLGREAYHDS